MVLKYLKQYRFMFLFVLLSLGIFVLILALVHVPLIPVLYALGLCAFVGAIFLFTGYFRFRRRYNHLMRQSFQESLEYLPEPNNPIEEAYQHQLEALFREKQQLTQAASQQRQDMQEYYTMWLHQIKTPISAMDLILQAGEGPENSEMKSELFKIRQYVEMVLTYLRLGSDSSDFVFRTTNLDDAIKTAIRNSSGQFIRQHVAVHFQETGLTAVTDEKWLLFVLEQLLSNCLKYAPGGSVSIFSSDQTTLVVQDDGIGIAPEDLPRVFEKGYTGLNGRRRRSTTGIGLYLCNEIMARLGHGIRIESAPGQGTSVILTFQENHLEFDTLV